MSLDFSSSALGARPCTLWRSGTRHLHTDTLWGILPALIKDGAGLGLKGILFDLDGVIVSTEHLHFEAYRQVLAPYSLDLTQELYDRYFRSRGRAKALAQLMPQTTPAQREQIGAQKDTAFLAAIEASKSLCFDDAIALIRALKANGLLSAVGTAASNGLALLERIQLDGAPLATQFNAIITGRDVAHNKPAPDIYLKCQAALNLPAESLLVIEDSEAGVQAALAAGLWVLQVHREVVIQVGLEVVVADA